MRQDRQAEAEDQPPVRIDDNPFYANPLGDSLAPATFVDRIEVPVFLAGAWQDEQTGGHFPAMLPNFTSSPHVYVTLTNGLVAWTMLVGAISSEVFQQLGPDSIADPEAFFSYQVAMTQALLFERG